jgi:dienelactone hydrolase
MKTIFVIVASLLFCSNIYTQNYQIGVTSKTYIDANRNNRQVKAEIYYPATINGNNASPANGKFPFIVFGHGFVMTYTAYENFSNEWVPKGYIMVFANTETGFSPNHGEFANDLSFLTTVFLQDNSNNAFILFNKIDSASAIMGHSMGGGCTILASANNTSIKTIIGFAPAETNPSATTAATNTIVPALIFSGEKDGVTPPAQHHLPIYNALNSSCKTFINIWGGAHCYFAKTNFNCDFGESTSSFGISISRQQQQQIAYDFATLWLNYFLKKDTNAFLIFMDSLQQSTRITYQNTCFIPSAAYTDFLPNNNLEIFPNPANSFIQIKSAQLILPTEIKIFSATGKLIQTSYLTDKSVIIDLQNFPAGMYYISCRSNTNSFFYKKLIVLKN